MEHEAEEAHDTVPSISLARVLQVGPSESEDKSDPMLNAALSLPNMVRRRLPLHIPSYRTGCSCNRPYCPRSESDPGNYAALGSDGPGAPSLLQLP